jgi:protein gp37
MGVTTLIEWTDATWNPVTGCTEISRGCDNCYARRIAERFRGTRGHPFENGFDVTLKPQRLHDPIKWKRPRRIFVNSMSDLFHKKVPTSFVDQVFEVMEKATWHIFQVLTKRSSLLRNYVNRRYQGGKAPAHIWLGVSVEDRRSLVRIRHLADTAASVRFLSLEPLLEGLGELDLSTISWVIVGGESGSGSRAMDQVWVEAIRRQCAIQRVPFFFKQWGAWGPDGIHRSKKMNGRTLKGSTWSEMPEMLQSAAHR